jgi:hypothetical protein
MTTPKHAIDSPNGRMYNIPGTDRYVPSVSTVLKEKRSPALANWDKKQSREEICDVWLAHPELYAIAENDGTDAKYKAIEYYWADMKARRLNNPLFTATELGTAVHACIDNADPVAHVQTALEDVAKESGRIISDEGFSAGIQDVTLKVKQTVECIEREKLEILTQELTVFNTDIGYSGTLDMIIKYPAKGAFPGGVCVADLKTSSKIVMYDENPCQIAAYANCNLQIDQSDITSPFPGWEDFRSDVGGVLKITPFQSRFTLIALPAAWETFKAAFQLRYWHLEWENLIASI